MWYATETENQPGGELAPVQYSQLQSNVVPYTVNYTTNPFGGAPIEYYKIGSKWQIKDGQTLLTIGDGTTILATITDSTPINIVTLIESVLGYSIPQQIIDSNMYISVNWLQDITFADASYSAKSWSGATSYLIQDPLSTQLGVPVGCNSKIYQIKLVTVA